MTVKVQLGSVSSGTMREEDLIPCFVDLLDELYLSDEVPTVNKELQKIKQRMLKDDYYESEDVSYDLNEFLFDALNEFAPPFCYFGSYPGDGADYGFWVSQDSIEDAILAEEMLKVDDLSEVPFRYEGYVLLISDHGNQTLYSTQSWGKLTEIWSIV
jgi:hypothetical protein